MIERHPRFVLATGGSLVSEPATFERLLTMCFTVWLRATPEDHMQRVIAQGDMRPMADNRESMSDLKRILEVREPLVPQGRRDHRIPAVHLRKKAVVILLGRIHCNANLQNNSYRSTTRMNYNALRSG